MFLVEKDPVPTPWQTLPRPANVRFIVRKMAFIDKNETWTLIQFIAWSLQLSDAPFQLIDADHDLLSHSFCRSSSVIRFSSSVIS
jgi:hypothetical protein